MLGPTTFEHTAIKTAGSTAFSPSQLMSSGDGAATLPLTNKKGNPTGQLSFTLTGDGIGAHCSYSTVICILADASDTGVSIWPRFANYDHQEECAV